MPETDIVQERCDLPHEDQMTRAESYEKYLTEGQKKEMAQENAAKEHNVDKRTIFRARKYKEEYLKLPEEIRESVRKYVNNKNVRVEYIYKELVKLDKIQQCNIVLKAQTSTIGHEANLGRHCGTRLFTH